MVAAGQLRRGRTALAPASRASIELTDGALDIPEHADGGLTHRKDGRLGVKADSNRGLDTDTNGVFVRVDETNAILTAEGDVVACAYVDQHGHPIDWKEHGIQTGCLRVSRELMQATPQPWFEYKVSEDGRQTTEGEAHTFSHKLIAAGQTAKIVGRIGHMLRMVALPPAADGAPTEVRYEWQFLP